ncbi:hypothetical protein ACFO8O_16630, partial [Hephaestia sp. GCM10023244]|uniref:hypothetical protein n=1 Tax=unclassified Hephaestia TaxID=2631281 RepID=UPI00207755E8
KATPDLVKPDTAPPIQIGECGQILETLKGPLPSYCKLQILSLNSNLPERRLRLTAENKS